MIGVRGIPAGPSAAQFGGVRRICDVQLRCGRARFRDYLSTPKQTPSVSRVLRGAVAKFPRVTLESAIYWSKTTGAHPISGGILLLWRNLGAENSALGYPIAGETEPASP
jgi:hypothetical protein